jgi:hypothetical protein
MAGWRGDRGVSPLLPGPYGSPGGMPYRGPYIERFVIDVVECLEKIAHTERNDMDEDSSLSFFVWEVEMKTSWLVERMSITIFVLFIGTGIAIESLSVLWTILCSHVISGLPLPLYVGLDVKADDGKRRQ